jgi:hypothetical protein
MAYAARGNPLDRVLGAAPLLEHMEKRLSALGREPTRMDLRLYKSQTQALDDFAGGEVHLLEMNGRDYLSAKLRDPAIQPLVKVVPSRQPTALDAASFVLFARDAAGLGSISELRGKSFLFSTADSALTFWAKVLLAEGGITARDLARYRYADSEDDLSRSRSELTRTQGPVIGNPYSDMTATEAVTEGLYDAAIVNERRFTQVAAAEKLVVLGRFKDCGRLIAVPGGLAEGTVAHLREVLTNLPAAARFQGIGYPLAFVACTDADFAEMRNKLAMEAVFDGDASSRALSAFDQTK